MTRAIAQENYKRHMNIFDYLILALAYGIIGKGAYDLLYKQKEVKK
jgi:hypothetical protein